VLASSTIRPQQVAQETFVPVTSSKAIGRAVLTASLVILLVPACMPIPGANLSGGTAPSFSVPAGALERRPVELPEGIESPPSDYVATDDLVVGEIGLPSGQIIVGEFLFDAEPLAITVPPGAYRVRATLARYADEEFENVALLSLDLSDRPTARWLDAGTFAVDGGSAAITSVETRDLLNRLFDASEADWLALNGAMYRSLEDHDYLATLIGLGPERDLAIASSGTGDGAYPIYVGLAADGTPTRVVLDFYLLNFEWPSPG
jgi:hypothetical protein